MRPAWRACAGARSVAPGRCRSDPAARPRAPSVSCVGIGARACHSKVPRTRKQGRTLDQPISFTHLSSTHGPCGAASPAGLHPTRARQRWPMVLNTICSGRVGHRAVRLEVFGDSAALGGGAGGVVGDHAGGFPGPGAHHFGSGGAASGELGGEADASGVSRQAVLDAGG